MDDTNAAAAAFHASASVTSYDELVALRIVRTTSTPEGEQTSELRRDSSGTWSPRAPFGSLAHDSALVPATRERAQELLDLLVSDRQVPPWTSLDAPAGVDTRPTAKPLGTTTPDPVGLRTRVIGVATVVILVALLQLALSRGWI